MAKKQQNKNEQTRNHNFWDVSYLFISEGFKLINTGKVFPLFGMVFMAFLSLTVWKMPGTVVGELALIFVNKIIISYGGLIAIFLISNLIWLFLWKRQRDNYEKEIERLSDIRSELMHKPDRRAIKNHRSTEDTCEETYLIPGVKEERTGGTK